jgi:NAD(P)-dependent dehydrogenase (short-subunit alcohol dehydrogenase family)
MKKPDKIWIIARAARGFGQQISKAVLASGNTVIATVRSRPEELKTQLGYHPSFGKKMVMTVIGFGQIPLNGAPVALSKGPPRLKHTRALP